jgi:3D (Asp-Asp-Asp) domain-containing protein
MAIVTACRPRVAPQPTPAGPTLRPPPRRFATFVATAYCQRGITAAGTPVREGVAAADPRVLPLGTVIRIEQAAGYDGSYTVLDTGRRVRGRRIDLYLPDCRSAVRFGRRRVLVAIVSRSG